LNKLLIYFRTVNTPLDPVRVQSQPDVLMVIRSQPSRSQFPSCYLCILIM